jgi:tetratricopeptide (TPR) repeat protein
LLTLFYVFVFTIIAFIGISLGWEKARHAREFSASILSLVPALLLLLLALFVIHDTNLQVIQADVVYKRADQWDKQAIRDGDPAMWDNAIAIYEHAIELAPREDFYYLWLGRAYLERSGVTADTVERAALLRTAEQRLIEAQRINPLNTDHTANLARLNTRWAEIAAEPERQERINIASDYYEAAMSLSPNNAVIINEYARLAFILGQDCDRALALFGRSQERDPYYATTLYEKYEVLRACGDQEETEAEKLHYYELAAETLSGFLSRQSRPAQEWLQLAGLYVVLERFDEAFDAYTRASEVRGDDLEQWRIDFTLADMYFQEGQLDKAEEFGLKALEAVPDELIPQLQEFLDNIAAARGEVGG